ncbi:Atxe2 family lasso peptide isopeptidase [Luteimonas sp. R10]|uniref:Atxe2 family lasso peptide isopeptidase n=1 Tax=Luteimonas sp. R10 TaxID=3108176 RepID=UPI00308E1052|nr:Atxe2 family lasso peptide isopeptidase [Luteimonas sp. R10]
MKAKAKGALIVVLGLLAPVVNTGAAVPGVTPRMLVEITDLSGVAISPDGASVAFRTERASIERNAYDASWYVQNLHVPDLPVRIADGGTPLRDSAGFSVAETPQWSRDSRWLYYRALVDGEAQVWRASRDGHRAEPVTSDAANIERFLLSEDGRSLVYRVGAAREAIARAEMVEYDRGVRFDDTIFGQQNLFRSHPIDGRLASPRTIHGQALLWQAPKVFRTVDLDTLEASAASSDQVEDFIRRSASPGDRVPGARAVAVSGDGRRIATLSGTYPASELRVLATAGNSPPLACQACKALVIEAMVWRGDDELVFTVRDIERGFAQSLYAWRVGESGVRLIVGSDGLFAGDRYGQASTCAVGLRHAACVSASASVAPRLERVDLDSGERLILADPNERLSRVSRNSTEVEFLSWTDRAGHVFTGHLVTPAGRKPRERLPLFITYFRCPGYLRGGYGDEWPLTTLASHGIASLCVNRPVLPSAWDQSAAEDYATALDGVESIIDLFDERSIVDRQRVGMGGLSYGGEVVAWIAGNSSLLSAASVATTQTSPAWYWFSVQVDGRADVIARRWELGAPEDTPEKWKELSPAFFADRIDAPFLMQIPEGEYRANLEFHIRLLREHTPTELWIYPNETHRKYRPRTKLSAYERNLDWFRFWLQDYEDPAGPKGEQHRRWRAMRRMQCEQPVSSRPPRYCSAVASRADE